MNKKQLSTKPDELYITPQQKQGQGDNSRVIRGTHSPGIAGRHNGKGAHVGGRDPGLERLVGHKGQVEVVECARQLLREERVRLQIVGIGGEGRGRVRQEAEHNRFDTDHYFCTTEPDRTEPPQPCLPKLTPTESYHTENTTEPDTSETTRPKPNLADPHRLYRTQPNRAEMHRTKQKKKKTQTTHTQFTE